MDDDDVLLLLETTWDCPPPFPRSTQAAEVLFMMIINAVAFFSRDKNLAHYLWCLRMVPEPSKSSLASTLRLLPPPPPCLRFTLGTGSVGSYIQRKSRYRTRVYN